MKCEYINQWPSGPDEVNDMKKIIIVAMLCAVLAATPAMAVDVFPDVELSGKLTVEQTAYLGAGDVPIKPSAIPADYLFVEVFSMYCPICQRDAPDVNTMKEIVLAKAPEGRIKFFGIGAGNTQFEVDFYAKKYKVSFPLFVDGDFVAHKALDNVGTPAFYLVDVKNGMKVVWSHVGALEDPDAIAAKVLGLIGK